MASDPTACMRTKEMAVAGAGGAQPVPGRTGARDWPGITGAHRGVRVQHATRSGLASAGSVVRCGDASNHS
eukprot:6308836-Prymnesium_polylepis.2